MSLYSCYLIFSVCSPHAIQLWMVHGGIMVVPWVLLIVTSINVLVALCNIKCLKGYTNGMYMQLFLMRFYTHAYVCSLTLFYAWLIANYPKSKKGKPFGSEGNDNFVILATNCHVYITWNDTYMPCIQSHRHGTKHDSETDPEKVEMRKETSSSCEDVTRNIVEMPFSMNQNVAYSAVRHTVVLWVIAVQRTPCISITALSIQVL